MADDRFAAELDLPNGVLQLGAGEAELEPLKPFRRHDLEPASRFDFKVTKPGRYRLLVQTGEGANLRLLQIRQEQTGRTGLPPMDGEAIRVVADVLEMASGCATPIAVIPQPCRTERSSSPRQQIAMVCS